MSLHLQPVTDSKGKTKYILRYWENNQHKTVPATEYPEFKTREEAKAFVKVQNAKLSADRHLEKHAKNMNHHEFKNKFTNFTSDVDGFLEWYKGQAKNSWEASRSWLMNYIIPYFIGEKLNNPNLWPTKFMAFKTWLENAETQRGSKLSPSSQGHIIKALNSYLKYLVLHNKMEPSKFLIKCPNVNRSLMKRRDENDLISEEEIAKLKIVLGSSRDFLVTLLNTGTRINELYSLQFSNITAGADELDETLRKPYEIMGAKIYGYIRLESQMSKKYAYRNLETGEIKRKPLKSKKEISPKNDRIIPIIDEETWGILVKNYNRAMDEWEARAHLSSNTDDYLLFNIDVSEIRRDLAKHTKRTPHCCRHTFTTNTVYSFRKVNYGPELIKSITGHTSSEFYRYVHLSTAKENKEKKKNPKRI